MKLVDLIYSHVQDWLKEKHPDITAEYEWLDGGPQGRLAVIRILAPHEIATFDLYNDRWVSDGEVSLHANLKSVDALNASLVRQVSRIHAAHIIDAPKMVKEWTTAR